MQPVRYFLPDHPKLTDVYGKSELRVLLQNGELSRSDMVCDDETGLAHLLGDLLARAYPDATIAPSRSTSSSAGGPSSPPPPQEFRADTPLQEPEPLPDRRELEEEEDEDDEFLAESPADEDPEAEEEEELDEDEQEDILPAASKTKATAEPEYLPGEEALLYVGHPSWKAYPRALVIFAVLVGAAAFCFRQGYGLEWSTLLGSIAGLILLFIALDRTTTTYYVTTRRVEMEFGIVGRNTKEVRICDIRSIDVFQKGYNALVGVGMVSFDSSASAGVEVWFKDVSKPHDIKQLVRQLQG